jgi:hypothetical protein
MESLSNLLVWASGELASSSASSEFVWGSPRPQLFLYEEAYVRDQDAYYLTS